MNSPFQSKESGFLRVKFETLDAAAGTFEGYGAVFGNVDLAGDIIERGAFIESLSKHRRAGTVPAMLWMHKHDSPIGRWLSLEEDSVGLIVRGKLNLATSGGREAHALIAEGDVTGLSIGFTVPAGASMHDSKRGVTRLKSIDLHEVSVVTVPANGLARIRLGSKGDLEDLLRKSGLPKEAARRVASGGWPALSNQSSTSPPSLTRLVQAVTKSSSAF